MKRPFNKEQAWKKLKQLAEKKKRLDKKAERNEAKLYLLADVIQLKARAGKSPERYKKEADAFLFGKVQPNYVPGLTRSYMKREKIKCVADLMKKHTLMDMINKNIIPKRCTRTFVYKLAKYGGFHKLKLV